MANVINFYEAKQRLRPEMKRHGFLIIELPEDVVDFLESPQRSVPWKAHFDITLD